MFIRQVKEPSEQLLLLRRGDVDIARDLTSDLLKTAASDSNLYKVTSPTTNQMYVAGNEGYAPFAKAEVRQAVKWAIDYDGIQKNIVPDTYIVNQAFEPSMILGAVNTNPFHKDPDKAKELLAKAGYPQGFSATLDHFSEHPYADIATAIQADLAAVGHQGFAAAGDAQADPHQDACPSAPDGDERVVPGLFRSELQRPGVCRRPGRFRQQPDEDHRLAHPFP